MTAALLAAVDASHKRGDAHAVRLAAVGDLHVGRQGAAALRSLLAHAVTEADVLLLCGDLLDHGLPDEARALAHELAVAAIPILAVLGNHDVESGHEAEVRAILGDAGVRLLDGDSFEVRGLGIAGVKGFAGGFGRYALGAWGEAAIKTFVHEAIEEALKLEAALSQLRGKPCVAMLHYAPIAATVVGESLEIYPFLGSSRLEEPLNRYDVAAIFHGHAHAGQPEGRTSAGVPVYNVAQPVLERLLPDAPPLRIVEIPVGPAATPPQAAPR
jgi:Icc-related predicted phosphoesterase